MFTVKVQPTSDFSQSIEDLAFALYANVISNDEIELDEKKTDLTQIDSILPVYGWVRYRVVGGSSLPSHLVLYKELEDEFNKVQVRIFYYGHPTKLVVQVDSIYADGLARDYRYVESINLNNWVDQFEEACGYYFE